MDRLRKVWNNNTNATTKYKRNIHGKERYRKSKGNTSTSTS